MTKEIELKKDKMDGARDRKIHARSKPKKYVCIAKIGNEEKTFESTVNLTGARAVETYQETFRYKTGKAVCIKHRLNNLLSYVRFLDEKFPSWTWFNVYSNRGENKGKQIGNFTTNARPIRRDV